MAYTQSSLPSPVFRASISILPLFVLTSFVSAWLLFAIQPMFAKMVLPLLGGAPNVWNTAMLFFQSALLAGYAYVHASTRFLGLRGQILVHMAVLTIAVISLPIQVVWYESGGGTHPILWLTSILVLSVGLPFFAVSATAPLLQRWFAHSGHPHAHDPYFLYGASNLGSILALLSYPILVEPSLRLGQQGWVWATGYGLLAVLIASCAVSLRRSAERVQPMADRETQGGEVITWGRRLHWVALAFAPSSLLLGVTSHITTDVAAVPLLWVIPLTLYLLTFVLVFARRSLLPHNWMVTVQPYVLVVVFICLPLAGRLWLPLLIGNLLVFFITTMVCHGELARIRPSVSRLTEFYFAMAFGGMLGGVFNALVAPELFSSVLEYPLALVAALMLRPSQAGGGAKTRFFDIALPLALLVAMMMPKFTGIGWPWQWTVIGYLAYRCVVMLLIFGFKDRPIRIGLALGAYLFVQGLYGQSYTTMEQARSFFGIYKVASYFEKGEEFNILLHGTTIHGGQSVDPAMREEPVAYYTRPGPLGQVFGALENSGRPRNIALIGLGTGATLCYQQPGQKWTVYEIDPLITRLAGDTRYFTYLADCMDETRTEIIHGDARLSLEMARNGQFELLILDAFSSDSVPSHLLTREAMQLYMEKLSEDGVIMFHISNRHLNLERVVSGLLRDGAFYGLIQNHGKDAEMPLTFESQWVIVARNKDALAFLNENPNWENVDALSDSILWTDDFSNIVSVIR